MMISKARSTALLLNAAHALDHMFLLVFATSVGAIAADFGLLRWEDLMPYGTGAFVLFGLGSLPAGRLGDHWGRRKMMLVFFFGMGASMLLIAATRNPWQLAIALTLMGAFSSIYHPVGIPMLVRGAKRPGFTIGVNGLSGNLGVALSAAVTGFLVQFAGWHSSCRRSSRSHADSHLRGWRPTSLSHPRSVARRSASCRGVCSRASLRC